MERAMVRRLSLSLLVLALAACNAETPPAAAGGDATPPPLDQPDQDVPPATAPVGPPAAVPGQARYDGYGDMRFGMTEAEARAAFGEQLNGESSEECHYLNPVWENAPSYFALMFEGGKFVRYDVGNDREVAPGGGRTGMGADEIRELYPDVVESPHKYVAGGSYLKVDAPEGDGKLVFSTDDTGTVTEWRAGVEPQVDYVEGCS